MAHTIPPADPATSNSRFRMSTGKQAATAAGVALVLACCGIAGLTGFVTLLGSDTEEDDPEARNTPKKTAVVATAAKPGDLLATASVSTVTTADSVDVTLSSRTWHARIIGIQAPTTAATGTAQCWGDQAKAFADGMLSQKQVEVFLPAGSGTPQNTDSIAVHLVHPDQSNYAIAALQAGAALVKRVGLPHDLVSVFETAQQKAKDAKAGIWGDLCKGNLQLPAAPTTPAPVTLPEPEPQPAPQPAPPPQAQPQPDSGSVYYGSCADARAAGAAPLYRGGPGYRSGLDSDDDGIACE